MGDQDRGLERGKINGCHVMSREEIERRRVRHGILPAVQNLCNADSAVIKDNNKSSRKIKAIHHTIKIYVKYHI